MSVSVKALARAKVNLFLHVAGPDAKAYHPLKSLVAFADFGDEVGIEAGPENLRLEIGGPFGDGLSTGEDNLMIRAARRFEQATGRTVTGRLWLEKGLPVASGLGGGSADAGATLLLLRQMIAPEVSDAALDGMAEAIGADGVMCLWARAGLAEGYGERLTSVVLPELPCVLINPGVACETRAVYGGFDALGAFADLEAEAFVDWSALGSVAAVIDTLKATRNDLQPPAIRIAPVIAEVLAALSAEPETRLARMSGSGATCFALCETRAEAEALAVRLRDKWPEAWIRAGALS